LSEDPTVRFAGHFAELEQVSFSKGIGGLPLVALFEEPLESDIELRAALRFIFPDSGLDVAQPNLVNRLCFRWHNFPFVDGYRTFLTPGVMREWRNDVTYAIALNVSSIGEAEKPEYFPWIGWGTPRGKQSRCGARAARAQKKAI
jgi:hypothetical protein